MRHIDGSTKHTWMSIDGVEMTAILERVVQRCQLQDILVMNETPESFSMATT